MKVPITSLETTYFNSKVFVRIGLEPALKLFRLVAHDGKRGILVAISCLEGETTGGRCVADGVAAVMLCVLMAFGVGGRSGQRRAARQ